MIKIIKISKNGIGFRKKFPDRFIPRYSMVSFNEISYSEVYKKVKFNQKIINDFISGKLSKMERDKKILDLLALKVPKDKI